MQFLLKCSEITAENNKRQFLKMSVKYFCKETGNRLSHSWRHLRKRASANFWRQSIN